MALAFTSGQMGACSQVSGSIAKPVASVFTHGMTDVDMRGSSPATNARAMEC